MARYKGVYMGEDTHMAETDWAPIIDDPLAWQSRIDASGLQPNMRGSARFWRTIQERYGLTVWYRDGAPDFGEIVFKLADGLGLELSTEEGSTHMRYRFVELDESSQP